MRWIAFLVGLSLFVVSVSAAKQDIILAGSLLRYDPSPAEPGRTVDVWLQFSNTGVLVDGLRVRFTGD